MDRLGYLNWDVSRYRGMARPLYMHGCPSQHIQILPVQQNAALNTK